jgi:nucleotide-binding universal stress UspA family protein
VRQARKRRRTTARRTKAGAPKRATLRLVEPEYRRILVAVDGSSTSEAALAAAVALSRALSGRLRVLHVVDSPYDYPDVMYGRVPGDREELGEAWHKAGQEVLDWAVAQVRQSGCEPESCLIEGNGAHTSQHIVEAARVWDADLIVVGRNGRRGLSRLLLGSVAEGVARTAPVPVLLVQATKSKVSDRA